MNQFTHTDVTPNKNRTNCYKKQRKIKLNLKHPIFAQKIYFVDIYNFSSFFLVGLKYLNFSFGLFGGNEKRESKVVFVYLFSLV